MNTIFNSYIEILKSSLDIIQQEKSAENKSATAAEIIYQYAYNEIAPERIFGAKYIPQINDIAEKSLLKADVTDGKKTNIDFAEIQSLDDDDIENIEINAEEDDVDDLSGEEAQDDVVLSEVEVKNEPGGDSGVAGYFTAGVDYIGKAPDVSNLDEKTENESEKSDESEEVQDEETESVAAQPTAGVDYIGKAPVIETSPEDEGDVNQTQENSYSDESKEAKQSGMEPAKESAEEAAENDGSASEETEQPALSINVKAKDGIRKSPIRFARRPDKIVEEFPSSMHKDDFTFYYDGFVVQSPDGKKETAEVIVAPLHLKEGNKDIVVWADTKDGIQTGASGARSTVLLHLDLCDVILGGEIQDGKFVASVELTKREKEAGYQIEHNGQAMNGEKGHVLVFDTNIEIHAFPVSFKNDDAGNAEYFYFISQKGEDDVTGFCSNGNAVTVNVDGKQRTVYAKWKDNILYIAAMEY